MAGHVGFPPKHLRNHFIFPPKSKSRRRPPSHHPPHLLSLVTAGVQRADERGGDSSYASLSMGGAVGSRTELRSGGGDAATMGVGKKIGGDDTREWGANEKRIWSTGGGGRQVHGNVRDVDENYRTP